MCRHTRSHCRRHRLCNVCGVLATGMEFLTAVERRATRLIGGLSPGGLHQLLQGFAELAWEPGSEFLAASEAAATAGLAALSPQELPELLIAYCRIGHQPGMQHVGACKRLRSYRILQYNKKTDQRFMLCLSTISADPRKQPSTWDPAANQHGIRDTHCQGLQQSTMAGNHLMRYWQASTSWRLLERRRRRAPLPWIPDRWRASCGRSGPWCAASPAR